MLTDRSQKSVVLILIVISAAVFLIFALPNAAASQNIEMVTVFEPDEAVPLPYVFNMIQPADTLKQALINFAFYKYFFYGFPYFAWSALLLIPLQISGNLGNTPWVMLILRQMVSVLPMLASIWVLVYLQTRFRGYRAVVLFLFLVTLPAVMWNNFWWHPDGLAIFFAMLTILFLDRDDLRFGRNFYLAAATCGISAGTKGIGFYFFLTIFVYLLIGFFTKKASIPRLIISALGFLACMAGAYLLVNPTLIYSSIRTRYFKVMYEQSQLLSQGYEVTYARGLLAALPEIVKDYASLPALIAVFGLCIYAIARRPRRLLHTIILTWALPTTFMICFLIHYKFQYWLPVALPLFSTIAILLPEKIRLGEILRSRQIGAWVGLALAALFFIQAGINIAYDAPRYIEHLHRAEGDASILFYDQVVRALDPLPADRNYHVYHDVRMYVPSRADWYSEARFEMLNYEYIREGNFDILLLMQQRIYDYLDPDVTGVDPAALAASQAFYRDAQNAQIEGYRLVYRNDFGLIYVREDLYGPYFQAEQQP